MRRKFFIAAILILGFSVAIGLGTEKGISETDRKKKESLFREVGLFSDALTIIQSDYVDETKPKDLIYGALKGMLSSLDPHSQFMDPDTYAELRVDTEGKFGGLGIEITIKDALLTVITPIEDTPAWKAGVKAGDRIVKINDELTRDMTLTEAVKKMRGKPGEQVILTIFRESEKKILEFKITRGIIKIKDIKDARILEDGIGYIRLVEFAENTPQEIAAALESLQKSKMNALILDLRNNAGGLLESAVRVTEKFIEKGKFIVSTKGRKPSQDLQFVSRLQEAVLNVPMVVLINEGSASGSEIVASCLQDHRRAIIVGTKSFGKGSVQTIVPLSDGSALRLTTARYFTPSGKVIHGSGVLPDIVVEEGRIEPLGRGDSSTGKSIEIFESIEKKEMPEKKDEARNYKYDNQLMRAVDILKAVKISKGLD